MSKLVVLIIIGCILSILLKQYCKEFLLLFQLAFSLCVLLFVFNDNLEKILSFFDIVNSLTSGDDILNVLLKAAGVSVLGKFGCDICKESGNHLLESVIELGMKMIIFVLSLPYILKIIDIAIEYL